TSSGTNHLGALSAGSCLGPSPESDYLTVGTPDFNGAVANSTGSLKLGVFCNGGAAGEAPPCSTTAGDQLDGKIDVSVTDVRCRGASGGCAGAAPSADTRADADALNIPRTREHN